MYKKNSVIYADPGKTLVKDGMGRNSITLGEGEKETDIQEMEINPEKFLFSRCEFGNYAHGYGALLTYAFDKDVDTYEGIRKGIIEQAYSSEKQFELLLHKNDSEEDAQEYKIMQEWIDFYTMLAKHIAKLAGNEVTETVDSVKSDVLRAIEKYDSSSEVNSFKYNGKSLWLNKETRVGLMNSTSILLQAGEKNTTLWLGDITVTLPCATVIGILSQIEMYALKCYNVTAMHKLNVNGLNTIEELKAYDYKAGYPEMPSF